MSSNELCKACTLLEGLERGMASSGIVSHLRFILSQCAERRYSRHFFHLQTDRARKKLESEGPAPDNLRTIPFFKMGSGSAAITVETPS